MSLVLQECTPSVYWQSIFPWLRARENRFVDAIDRRRLVMFGVVALLTAAASLALA